MGRPVFPFELTDPDFTWLLNSYQENNPNHTCFECDSLPIVLLKLEKECVQNTLPFVPESQDSESTENFLSSINKK